MTITDGDSGSPVAPTTTAFSDGENPWATVATDANGKVTRSYRDAFGRTVTNTQGTANGNVNTVYGYDLLGNLTNTTDNAGNSTLMVYDSLGRKISMTDPDMGIWAYTYDNDSRLVQQIDAKNNTIQFSYNDPRGRLTSKQIYNSAGALAGTVTYTYDYSSDQNYIVYPGQLYEVTDLQGHERFSYDVRGRTLKDSRFLSVNAMEYVTQATYDDADRVQQLTYPGSAAVIQYSYDYAGHLSHVQSLSGTGPDQVFYTTPGFNALDEPTNCIYGNGVATTYFYYPNSSRLEQISAGTNGANYQNLTYKYDNCSDVTNVSDGVNPTGAASASASTTYDDMYRVTSINSAARGAQTYSYNSIGNIELNTDFGHEIYQYNVQPQVQPHMVRNANGVNYSYDSCGNMTNRGNQTLTYDAQNQLIQVSTTNDTVRFGYDDSGERLWRAGTNGYTVWIGGIYEINNGKVLCHVIADGQLIATFEPQCTAGLAKVFGKKNWYAASTSVSAIASWPFRNGRGQWTLFGGLWAAILGICMAAGRGAPLNFRRRRRQETLTSIQFGFRRAITILSISAFLLSGIGNVDAAPVYTPVFYFYSTDYLGSSSILTDRSGNLVQQYGYTTFGQTTYQSSTSAFPVSNRYTGQIADDETGLYYYGGRYYDPQLGRFIQPDPEIPDPTDSQSFNRYSYCRNNPLNEVDPSGFDDFGNGDLGGYWGDGNWGGYGNGDPSFGQLGNLFGGTVGGLLGSAVDAYNTYSSTSFNFTEFNSGNNSGFDLSINSGGLFGEGWNFSFPGGTSSGNGGPSPFVEATGPPLNLSPPSDPLSIPTVAAPAPSSGGWLSGVTNAAGILSMIPGPAGTIFGLVNAGGEALQGHFLAAGIGLGTAVLAVAGLGFVGKIAKSAVYEVGLAKDLRNAPRLFTEVNHVPQTAQARSLIGDYNLVNKVGNEAAIRLPISEHLAVNAAQAARPYVPATARELLAQDIRILRNNTQAPNAALQKLIQMNKTLHPTDFAR